MLVHVKTNILSPRINMHAFIFKHDIIIFFKFIKIVITWFISTNC